MQTRIAILWIVLPFLLGGSALRAEFPPETFPPESGGQPSNSGSSYEENEARSAEEEYLNGKKRPPSPNAAPPRRRAGVSKQSIPEAPSGAPFQQRLFFTLGGGVNLFSSSNATANSTLATLNLKTQIGLNLSGEFQFTKYFGGEVEGFLSTSPNQQVQFTSGGPIETFQVTASGAYFGLRAEWPVPASQVLWRPRFLLGYGLANTSQTHVASGTTTSLGIQASGLYVGVGVEAVFSPTFKMLADGMLGLATSGSQTTSGTGGTSSSAANGSSFNRIRLAANYRLTGPFWIGATAMLRSQSSAVATNTSGKRYIGETNSTLEFLATASMEL